MIKLNEMSYEFPRVVVERVARKYPSATPEALSVAFEGFLQYAQLCKSHPDVELPMFSKSVDEVWHQFILDTRSYQNFCEEHLGFFLHHAPNGGTNHSIVEEEKKLKTLWLLACAEFGYEPLISWDCPALFRADDVLEYYPVTAPVNIARKVRLDIEKRSESNKGFISRWFTKRKEVKSKSEVGFDYEELMDYFLTQTPLMAPSNKGPLNYSHSEMVNDFQSMTAAASVKSGSSRNHHSDDIRVSDYSSSTSHHHHHSCSSSSSSHSSHSCSSSSCSSSSSSSSSCGGGGGD